MCISLPVQDTGNENNQLLSSDFPKDQESDDLDQSHQFL